MSSVLVPAALNEKYFSKSYRNSLVAYLRGVRTNGVLLAASRKNFIKRVREEIETLPTRYGQQVGVLIEEILKEKNLVVNCTSESHPADEIDQAFSVMKFMKSDAILASSDLLENIGNVEGCIDIEDYSVSDFENQRAGYMGGSSFLDKLEDGEVDDMFIRTVKYSRTLRFFDSYLGQNNQPWKIKRFTQGISYILTLWREHGIFNHEHSCEIEFITLPIREKQEFQNSRSGRTRTKLVDNPSLTHKLLVNELIIPLSKKFPEFQLKLLVKKCDDRSAREKFHARFLQSQTAILQLDRGFDFIDDQGNFVATNIKWARGEIRHLQELRKFPEIADSELISAVTKN